MKNIVVTGATSGIGYQICLQLLSLGQHVIMIGRKSEKTDMARDKLKEIFPTGQLDLYYCDLADLDNVRELAASLAKFPKIDVLINNAGLESSIRRVSPQGFELTWAVNFLAPVLLTTLLLPNLFANIGSRVIFTSSLVEKWGKLDFADLQLKEGYNPEKAYYRSKLALLLYAYALSANHPADKLSVFTFEPGLTKTDFSRDFKGIMKLGSKFMQIFMKEAKVPAETAVFLALSTELNGLTGKNYFRKKEKATSKQSYDSDLKTRLMQVTENELNIKLFTVTP